jgi:carbamoyltransferase
MTPCRRNSAEPGPLAVVREAAAAYNRAAMSVILGVSAFYHDSAAALLVDGRIVAAAQEERFTRKKHDHRFPTRAIDFCLAQAGLGPQDLDYVGFYDKPLLKFERLLETYLAYAPRGFGSFLQALPLWFRQKLHLPRELRNGLRGAYRNRFVFAEHHESHAASAFFPSPFDEAAILTLDGVGEWATASFGVGRGNRIDLTHELRFPHSLGLLYSAFTYFTGFRVNSGEYKLMGLAPYGTPRFAGVILDKLIDLKPDGSFRMDMSYFNYCQGLTMTSPKFDALFEGPPRRAESPLTEREMDIAASIQQVTEEIMLRCARHVHAVTGMKHLCLAGGVALNCVGNGRILREGPFDDIWIQPAAGDAGGALGVALFISHQLLDTPREPHGTDSQSGSLLGPRHTPDDIRAFLAESGATAREFTDDDALCEFVAGLIAEQKVVGWFQGRMEFGPRALGCRSIIGDPRSPSMQSTMNLKIKFRESFRPFAPSILRDHVHEFFEVREGQDSPYMLLVAPVQAAQRRGAGDVAQATTGLEKLKVARSTIPAVTHVDHSVRVQTVDAERHGRYHRLLQAFERQTGCPVLINTSFNVRGEPIVCRPSEAYRCFLATHMDVLVLENFVLLREQQTQAPAVAASAYLAQFELD